MKRSTHLRTAAAVHPEVVGGARTVPVRSTSERRAACELVRPSSRFAHAADGGPSALRLRRLPTTSGCTAAAATGFLLAVALVLLTPAAAAADTVRVLDARRYHLGTAGQPEWQEFANKTPHGKRLDITFTAQTNLHEATLFLWQDNVKLEWGVELNGRKIGKLFLMEASLIHTLPVPAGALRDGTNTLSITPPKDIDDILVGEIKLDPRSLPEAIERATLEIQVTDAGTGSSLPCRLTIVDRHGNLTPIHTLTNPPPPIGPVSQLSTLNSLSRSRGDQPSYLAVRPGVAYTANGHARLGLLPGNYTINATRGFEYSLATKKISLRAGQILQVNLKLRREVPTPGYVSSDTHVHTFTYSRHGDATIDERMITLAGEGIELPIATDHDILTDYSEPSQRLVTQNFFTPVIGCEVTTAAGHFNVFPVVLGSRVPDFRIRDWPALMQNIRSTPGVRVVVLNHPRNIHSNFQPFAATNFNAVTGENRRGPEFTFDAIEVVNSSALQSDVMLAFHDWFALLNYGYRVTAVGSSDVHDVSRYIVGQGRSYVRCDDRDPARLNVTQACESFLQGRVLVSLGLLAQITVNGQFGVGDLATSLGEKIRVSVTVLGPSWTRADRVELFANGVKIREQQISSLSRNVEKAKITWKIPCPPHDVHLVAVASGPPITAPYWAIPHPYQPTSRIWNPRVLACTNPVWLDADSDGKFTSPRAYATALLQRTGAEPAKLLPALAPYDEAIAAQAASLCQAAGRDVRGEEFGRLLGNAPAAVQRGFTSYAGTLPPR